VLSSSFSFFLPAAAFMQFFLLIEKQCFLVQDSGLRKLHRQNGKALYGRTTKLPFSLLPEALSLFTKPQSKDAKMLIDEAPVNIVNITCHGSVSWVHEGFMPLYLICNCDNPFEF
jgi:hypothetical protein